MGNRKSKITTAVIDKPRVSTPKESYAPVVVTEPSVTEPPVTEPPVTEPPVTEPTVPEVVVTEPAVVADPMVEEPTVEEPTVEEPTVTEPTVTEPPTVSEHPTVTEIVVTEPVIVTEHFAIPALDSIQEVDEQPETDVQARPTVKSDSSRSLKITFMSASHDPYAYLPKKEQPETKSKHGKKFKKHHAKMEAEKMVDPPSSTNMDEMD